MIASRTLVVMSTVLLALQSAGAPLGAHSATMAASLALLIFGLPHGALDLELLKLARADGERSIGLALALYVGLALGTFLLWMLLPLAALSVFLLIAVAHFAEDWGDLELPLLPFGMAAAVLCVPALFHQSEVAGLFDVVAGTEDGARLVDIMVLVAPVSVAIAAVGVRELWRRGQRDRAIGCGCALTALATLPPVIGFACFFCLLHSPYHLGAALDRLGRADRTRRAWVIAPLTLAALGAAALLYLVLRRADATDGVVAASFMTLSILTVPHMAVPVILAALRGHKMRLFDRSRMAAVD